MDMNLQAWIANLGNMNERDVQEEIGVARGWLNRYRAELSEATSTEQKALKTSLVSVQERRLAYLKARV